MAFGNWLELGALLLVIAAGTLLWWLCRRKLRNQDGFEGIIEERGKLPARRKLDVEEEIASLESILGRR